MEELRREMEELRRKDRDREWEHLPTFSGRRDSSHAFGAAASGCSGYGWNHLCERVRLGRLPQPYATGLGQT